MIPGRPLPPVAFILVADEIVLPEVASPEGLTVRQRIFSNERPVLIFEAFKSCLALNIPFTCRSHALAGLTLASPAGVEKPQAMLLLAKRTNRLVGQSVAELEVPLGSSELTIHVARPGLVPDAKTYRVQILRGDLCEGAVCDDQNECTEDVCDPLTGLCENTPVEDGTACAWQTGGCSAGECSLSGWFWQNPLPTGSDGLHAVSFTDANNGIAVGDSGTIVRTTDGGTTWVKQTAGTDSYLNDVSFTDANTGTAVGQSGTILRTTNGGATWTAQNSGTTNWLRGMSFTDANNGTAVGGFGTILRTTDGGATWVAQDSGTTDPLAAVSFTDANNGTVVGDDDAILRTTDGGAIWVDNTAEPSTTSSGYRSPMRIPGPLSA